MNSVIFLYAAIAIDVGLCVKWHFDDKREAEREQQAELHRKQAAEERLEENAGPPLMNLTKKLKRQKRNVNELNASMRLRLRPAVSRHSAIIMT